MNPAEKTHYNERLQKREEEVKETSVMGRFVYEHHSRRSRSSSSNSKDQVISFKERQF